MDKPSDRDWGIGLSKDSLQERWTGMSQLEVAAYIFHFSEESAFTNPLLFPEENL